VTVPNDSFNEQPTSAPNDSSVTRMTGFDRQSRITMHRVTVGSLLAVAAIIIGTAAWAYWTAAGAGGGTAASATLAPPTNLTAVATPPNSSTVHLTWTASTLSGGQPAQGYYVLRIRTSDGATFAACGTSPTSLTTAVNCDDQAVPDGAFRYQVTAIRGTWTAVSALSNTVVIDSTAPTVTINQAAGQADPTNASPVNFTVVFSESVTGFTSTDITFIGTAGATTATVTGTGATYNVAVSGMTGSGTVRPTIAAGSAADAAGNGNTASSSTDNTVTYNDTTAPTVTINQAAGQADPTNASPVNFTVVFSEPVTGFTNLDVLLTGSAVATTVVVTGTGATYNVAVSGITTNGTVQPTVLVLSASDAAGNLSLASTSTDNTVTFDSIKPTVSINQATGQADPTKASPVNFTVVFSEPVTGFTGAGISFTGTSGATIATVTGSGTTYNVAVSGMTANGTVQPTVAAGKASDAAGNPNVASTSTDNTVTYDTIAPTVTGLAYSDGTAAQGDKVTGTAELGATVTATQTQGPHVGTTYTATAGTGGAFTIIVDNIASGTVTYSVTAKDSAGNVSSAVVLGPVTDSK
jgi:Bacterial Ig domain